MMRRLLRTAFAALLVMEALSTGLRAATRLPMVAVYPWLTVAFMALRLAVALQQFTAGWMVIGRRPPAARLARWVYAQSAVLLIFELGFRFAPTNIFPSYRWWFVGGYWAYALAGMLVFRRDAGDEHG